jgi:putative membrane protein
MTRVSIARRIACLGLTLPLLLTAVGTVIADAQTAALPEAPATLNAIDFNFVGQANLGAPFQVDSGRLAETKGTSAAIRDYANLMVTSHIPVTEALNVILRRNSITPRTRSCTARMTR